MANTSMNCLEALHSFYRLFMEGKFIVYLLCFKKLCGENKRGPSDRKEAHCEVAVLLPLLLLLFVVGKAQRKLLNFYLLECFLKPLHLQ